MKKLSIENAINSGDWYEYKDGDRIFRFRIISFRKVQLSEIENIDRIDSSLPINDGILLLISIELINLSKNRSSGYGLYLSILDEEDFKFNDLDCNYLTKNSGFARRNNLRSVDYIPKFKYKRGLIFLVPNENSKYYLTTTYDAIITKI